MRLRTDRTEARTRVRVAGPVEAGDLPRLRTTLLRVLEDADVLVLDGGALGEADAACAQVLIAARRTAESRGKRFEMAGCREQVLRALALTTDGGADLGLGDVL